MLRYTARNGTTFHFDPAADPCSPSVQVISADHDGASIPVDLDDLREFMQYLEDVIECQADAETDADLTAVGPD